MVTKTAQMTLQADPAVVLAAVPHSDDVVEYTMRCVLALAPQLNQAVLDAADRQVRDVFGRCKPYVAVRQGEGRSERNEAIRRDFQAGERVPLLMRRYDLSRATIMRILAE
jgi:Mor family transcriptional regulator